MTDSNKENLRFDLDGNAFYVEQCHHCLKLFKETSLCRIESEKGQPKVCVKCYKVWRALADGRIKDLPLYLKK